ncbi:hypothetical protein ACFQE5_19355 [Pseudonocardia hispaniensis]|uniref:5'-nucleotidase n=1 Tax=Pseudonocardia hispaniensis TaxID=904933 RepID=A0ABW1J7M9_9PSEU
MARTLITNDDRVDSPGLWALAAAACGAGLEVDPHGSSCAARTSAGIPPESGRITS